MRAVLLCLLGSLVLSTGAAAQVVVNEVYTGTPDFIEIRNLGSTPVDVSGWTVQSFQSSFGTPSPEPAFVIPAGTVIAGMEQLVLEEYGSAGAQGTLGPCSMRVGFNYNWTGSRNVEVRIVDTSLNVVDYVYRNVSGSGGNPNSAGATFTGVFGQSGNVFGRNGDVDTDDASDWAIFNSTSECMPNPGQMLPPPPFDLQITTTGVGDVTVTLNTDPAVPGAEFFTLVSSTIYDPEGSGPLFGVGLDALPLFQVPAFPGNPFHSNLDGNGDFTTSYGPGTLPGGLRIQAVSLFILSNGEVQTSDVEDVTF